jgi:hypothetical protein
VEVDWGGEGEKMTVVSVGVKSLPPPFSVIHNPDVHAIVGSEEVSRSVIGILIEFASSSINPLPAKVGEEKFAYAVRQIQMKLRSCSGAYRKMVSTH